MPYIGSAVSKSTDIKRITFATTTTGSGPFALGWTPASENTLRVTVNGVVQQDSSMTLSGANLTLVGVTLVSGDELEVQGIVNVGAMDGIPMDGSVTEGKIGGNAVTAAKIASGAVTAAKIGADAVGASAIATGAVGASELAANSITVAQMARAGTSGQVLTSAGTGADSAWAAAAAKDNLPAFYVRFTGGDQTLVDAAATLITWDTSVYDTASGYNTTASGTNPRNYTVQTGGAGKWFLTWGVYCYTSGGVTRAVEGNIYKNGSLVQTVMHSMTNTAGFNNLVCSGSVVIELVVADYVTVYGLVDVHTGTPKIASHAGATWFAGFRLAE